MMQNAILLGVIHVFKKKNVDIAFDEKKNMKKKHKKMSFL